MRFAAGRIAELAPNRHEDRVRQNIRRRNPGGVRDADAEIADDFRKRKVDDRLVETAEEGTKNNGSKNPPAKI